jgi:hypothetical protein
MSITLDLHPEEQMMKSCVPCSLPAAARTFLRPALALALAATALGTAPARADNLDAALSKHAPEIISYLHNHHCGNVGILKFRVHKAGHQTSFKAGPINENLAGRLELAMIGADPKENSIGIIHDADQVAVARRLPSYFNEAGQRELFKHRYPLAWGDNQVTPDLFLIGMVNVPADLKTATVVISAFGPESTRQDRVLEFQVKTDRSLLTDLGESFKVSSRGLKAKRRAIELDEEATDSAADQNAKPAGPDGTNSTAPSATSDAQSSAGTLLYYEIRYDGQPQQVTTDPDSPGEFVVAEPKENQQVSFLVKSLASERIGLVLMINGKSTLYEEDGDPSHCKAWVLDPGREYGIYGFQVDNNSRKPFRVLSDAESAAVAYSENVGKIQFHIFRSGSPAIADGGGGGDSGTKDDSQSQAMNISYRGLKRSATNTRSLSVLKDAIQAHAHTGSRVKKRGLIMGDNQTVAGSIENDEVQNQVLVQSITVRYYKPKGQ